MENNLQAASHVPSDTKVRLRRLLLEGCAVRHHIRAFRHNLHVVRHHCAFSRSSSLGNCVVRHRLHDVRHRALAVRHHIAYESLASTHLCRPAHILARPARLRFM